MPADAVFFGHRTFRWPQLGEIFSVMVLLIPTIATVVLLAHLGLPLWPYLACAALDRLGRQ
ncbi:hypothetical protein ABFA25_13100 [Mycobacterium lepromatosis]|nr:hypothetical protein [Mycobacterium lepromatosis]